MAPDLSKEKRNEFLRAVDDGEAEADKTIAHGQRILQTGHFVKRMAGTAKDLGENIPDDCYLAASTWNVGIMVWNDVPKSLNSTSDIELASGYTTGSTTLSTSDLTLPASYLKPLPEENQKRAEEAAARVKEIVEAASWDEKLAAEFARLGLDQTVRGERSALELFRAAHEALSRPSAGEANPTGVLITVRECVNRTLADLLRRRLRQEPARSASEKVRSICKQIGKTEADPSRIEFLAGEAPELICGLSRAKQEDLHTPQVHHLFLRTQAFLRALLSLLDDDRVGTG